MIQNQQNQQNQNLNPRRPFFEEPLSMDFSDASFSPNRRVSSISTGLDDDFYKGPGLNNIPGTYSPLQLEPTFWGFAL